MKVGQEVSYVDADDKRHTATVTAIVGVGPSYSKQLDLEYGSGDDTQRLEGVYHELDAPDGEGFWLLKGERRSRAAADEPAGAEEADVTKEDLKAFPDTTDAAPPKANKRGNK